MTFSREEAITPVAIAGIEVTLIDPDPTRGELARATFEVRIRLSNGETVLRAGDLATHITPAQRTSLLAFMATLRAKAVAEVLP